MLQNLRALNSSSISNHNELLCQKQLCSKKPNSFFKINESNSQSRIRNDGAILKLFDESSKHNPNNSVIDRSQTLSLFNNPNRQKHRDEVNQDQPRKNFFCNPLYSPQLNESSDINIRDNGDHQFKRPNKTTHKIYPLKSANVRKFDQIQNVNLLSAPNILSNTVGSVKIKHHETPNSLLNGCGDTSIMSCFTAPTYSLQKIKHHETPNSLLNGCGDTSIMSCFTAPTYSLQKIKEELLTTVSVIELLNLQIGIQIDEMKIDSNIIPFLIKLKRRVQKLVFKNASLISMKMTMEQAMQIQQWLNSSWGHDEQVVNSNNVFKDESDSQTNSVFCPEQQIPSMSRKELKTYVSQVNKTIDQNQHFNNNNISEINEEMDLSLFNNTGQARLRDQSVLNVRSVYASSLKNSNKAFNLTKSQQPSEVAIYNELGSNTDPSLLTNPSGRVSSRGRLIKPKKNFWDAKESTPSSLIGQVNVPIQEKCRSNAISSDLFQMNVFPKERKQDTSKQETFKKLANVNNKKPNSKQNEYLISSDLKSKQTGVSAVNESVYITRSVSKSAKKKNNTPDIASKTKINMENLQVDRDVPEAVKPAVTSCRGRKRKGTVVAPNAVKRKNQLCMDSNSINDYHQIYEAEGSKRKHQKEAPSSNKHVATNQTASSSSSLLKNKCQTSMNGDRQAVIDKCNTKAKKVGIYRQREENIIDDVKILKLLNEGHHQSNSDICKQKSTLKTMLNTTVYDSDINDSCSDESDNDMSWNP